MVKAIWNGEVLAETDKYEIVEANGGEIWVESWAGKGSRFSFSLPVCKKEKLSGILEE